MATLLKHGARRVNEALDEFRRATGAAARAIGRTAELDTEFVTENPGAAGNTVRIERPDPSLPYQQVVRARGQADSAALKLRHHDATFHARQVPRSAQARQVFNALEQTRCEVLGRRRWPGSRSISTRRSRRGSRRWTSTVLRTPSRRLCPRCSACSRARPCSASFPLPRR